MAASAPVERNDDTPAPNPRSRRKSDRRLQLLGAAERLFAERGFLAVRLE
ncbi:MAG TPA: TetR/AcrR family transcriptional regulator, partial [Mycobacterium sp.]|nr:TetR/AcrR family transcriptional regulator [Mycobacterium sp.]